MGKMSHSDKIGATLPKVATVASLLRNDNKKYVIASVACRSRRSEYGGLYSRSAFNLLRAENTIARVAESGYDITVFV